MVKIYNIIAHKMNVATTYELLLFAKHCQLLNIHYVHLVGLVILKNRNY